MVCPLCKGYKTTSHRGDPDVRACTWCHGRGTISQKRYAEIKASRTR